MATFEKTTFFWRETLDFRHTQVHLKAYFGEVIPGLNTGCSSTETLHILGQYEVKEQSVQQSSYLLCGPPADQCSRLLRSLSNPQ